jgi:hypothetical protein
MRKELSRGELMKKLKSMKESKLGEKERKAEFTERNE